MAPALRIRLPLCCESCYSEVSPPPLPLQARLRLLPRSAFGPSGVRLLPYSAFGRAPLRRRMLLRNLSPPP
eukprot:6188175-Pleurochrysis_carterae.AAC.2